MSLTFGICGVVLAGPVLSPAWSPFYAFEQSDLFGRLVVLLLFCASILAWSIMLEKWLYLKRVERSTSRFWEQFGKSGGMLSLPDAMVDDQPMAMITRQTLATAEALTGMDRVILQKELGRGRLPALSPVQQARLKAVVEAAVDEQLIHLEARLGLLSSIVSASPFLGLLGTVWGVMSAFTGMAMAGRANIQAIAPGVSGALLTTVVGLLVAIPAVIGYNFLTSRVKCIAVRLDNFAADLITRFGCADSTKTEG